MSIDHYSGRASTVFKGLELAIERITGRSILSDQIAIGESLYWGIALDELLHKAHGDRYVVARDAHPLGACVNGGRLARNAITHGAVIVQSTQGGHYFPYDSPVYDRGAGLAAVGTHHGAGIPAGVQMAGRSRG